VEPTPQQTLTPLLGPRWLTNWRLRWLSTSELRLVARPCNQCTYSITIGQYTIGQYTIGQCRQAFLPP
jgi:hypothetical protein